MSELSELVEADNEPQIIDLRQHDNVLRLPHAGPWHVRTGRRPEGVSVLYMFEQAATKTVLWFWEARG